MLKTRLTLLATAIAAHMSAQAAEKPANLDEMWKMIQQQQAEISALKQQINNTQKQVVETDEKVEATGAMLEAGQNSVNAKASKSQFGGYGELHYNNLSDDDGNEKNELDLHRFVLFFGHQFSDRVRFFSELEVEHALSGDGKPGEVEVEQAYVELDLNEQMSAKAGVFLLPIGIINETHEPPTFYGTERNPVEKNIIPATWWEGGVALSGRLDNGIQYDAAIHSGLAVSDSFNIRKGRQKTAKAKANKPAMTGRLKYTGIPGLELATSVNYQSDIGQEQVDDAGSAVLWEAHAVYQKQNFGLKALYAQWQLSGSGAEALGADKQVGWYIEPSYKFNDKIGVFARYNVWDTQAGNDIDSEYSQVDFGVNYWPHEDVVLKFDYQIQDAPEGKSAYDGFNLGVGYQF